MTRPAAATRRHTEESSTLATAPVPRAESTVETACVIPPMYLGVRESLDRDTPNYSSMASDYSGYSSVMVEELAHLPDTEEAGTAEEEAEAETSSDSRLADAEMPEADTAESGAAVSEGEGASVDGEESASDAETSDEENSAVTDDDGSRAPAAHASTNARGGDEEPPEGIEAHVARLPRQTPIRTPYVGSPPPQAVQRRDEIIKRSGAPPELHHAKVRQSVEQVAQTARDAQRRMVWLLGNIARDSRISIEGMADEIMKATAAAVAQINQAIDRAMADIDAAAEERAAYLASAVLLTGDELEANRNFTNEAIASDLRAGSEAVTALNDVATGRFDTYLGEAENKILSIPDDGSVGRIPDPAPRASSGDGNAAPSDETPANEQAETPYKIMADADMDLQNFLMNESAVVGGETGPQATSYYEFRATPVMEGMEARTQTQLVQGAQQKAETLSSDATRAQFLVMLLGLTTPVSKYHENDQSQAEDENERELLSQMTETEAAHYRANNILFDKRDLAKQYADRDLRNNLTDNLWKAGNKGAKGLRKKAADVEVAINNNAPLMAEAYRDLVDRLNALLPPGKFLDSREIVPRLIAARNQARLLQTSHETAAKEQSHSTLEQMQAVKKQQINGLYKAAHDASQSVTDVVTQTSFDMEMFVMQMTGATRAGASACMAAAQEYANRTAQSILDSIHGASGPGMDRVNSVAVGFLNGNISGAEQAQFMQLSAFVETMETEGVDGPLIQPMISAQDDLNERSTAIDNAMPERSTGTSIGLGLVSPIALGVYLYSTDPDEDVVVTQLGGLMWPGILALEEVFAHQGHGSLQGRIRDRLGNPEKTDALNLFSSSDTVRADARMSIINNSTHWYSDYNRASREAVASGMNAGERGTLDSSQIEETRQILVDDLDANQSDIALAYITGNRERAVAARTREALDNGRKEGQWGWIFSAEEARRRSDQARVDAIAGVDAMLRRELAVENAFANTMTSAELSGSSGNVYREFASLTDPLRRSAASFSLDEAHTSLINYASQSHASVVLHFNPLGLAGVGPVLVATPETVNMSAEARNFIEASVRHGGESNEARIARGTYEMASARREGGSPSSAMQARLSDALENREMARLARDATDMNKTPAERSRAARLLEEERVHHRERMMAMARGLGAPEDVANDPVRAEEWMRNQVGDLFAKTDSVFQTGPSHRRYGEEMITLGRASLDASVALATDGIGTRDDLLRRAYVDRSHAEIDAANARWAREHHGESMEEMLGLRTGRDSNNGLIGTTGWWSTFGAETSGDLAMELEVLAHGNPENDTDRIEIANLRYVHQRVRGTGFIAEHTMAGTDEQRFLDGSRVDMARTILDEAVRRNPELAGRFDTNPLSIFNADGSINSDVAVAAFDNGNFRGSTTALHNAIAHIGYAADAYRAEIDRQESMMTTGITVLALVASLALMVVPGVNVVAAGIITAIVAGAATLAVKYGMRGQRYGWEEAATDVATTAIEAATAGISGGLAGGLGKVGMAGRLARIGASMEKVLGSRVAAAVVREAMVNAVSSAASTAIQDDIWEDGFSRGLERVANGAIRGAVVGAVSAGVSESLTAKLNTRMNLSDVDPANMNRWQKMATALGPHGSEMFREALSNGLGTLASESVGLTIDYAQGNFHGDFGDVLKHLGMATLRETATGALRGGIMSMNRARYRNLLEVARAGRPLSTSELHALRLFAISAGAMNYGDDISHMRHEVDAARDMLSRMPPSLREYASSLDVHAMENLLHMLNSADLGELKHTDKRNEFLRELGESVPGIDTRALMAELQDAIKRRTPTDADAGLNRDQQDQLRSRLGEHLHQGLKFTLDGVRLEGMQHLSDAELTQAAAMIARGRFNSADADSLMRAAKTRNPDLDEFGFLSNLRNAVNNAGQAQAAIHQGREIRRQQLLAVVPEAAASLFAGMSDVDIAIAQKLIHAGTPGTPQERDALFRAAQANSPELSRDQFHQIMAAAAAEVRTRQAAEASVKRAAREATMSHVPEELRSTLSALPETGLVELRLRQMQGGFSPAEKIRLMDMARQTTPDIDLQQLSHALDRAVATPAKTTLTETLSMELRRHLLSGVPAEQRSALQNTHIMVLSDAEFVQLTHSQKGQAVTLIIDGQPLVVMREGANPRALREEGIHALQARDPQWARHIGLLDEKTLANWDQLPLEQQLVLYRNKVALELDAQQRIISSIETDITRATSREEKQALQRQLEQAVLAHENLSRRSREAGGIEAIDIANIKAGFSERPQWLDQPARLFNKVDEIDVARNTATEAEERDALIKKITGNIPLTDAHHELIRQLNLDEINSLHRAAEGDANQIKTLMDMAIRSEYSLETLTHARVVLDGLAPEIRRLLIDQFSSTLKSNLPVLLDSLHTLRHATVTPDAFELLVASLSNSKNRVVHVEARALANLVRGLVDVKIDVGGLFTHVRQAAELSAVLQRIHSAENPHQVASELIAIIHSANLHSAEHAAQLMDMLAVVDYDDFGLVIAGLATARAKLPDTTTFSALLDVLVNSSSNKNLMLENLNSVLAHLDPKACVALVSLIDQIGDSDRINTLSEIAMVAELAMPVLEKQLLGVDGNKLLNVIIETIATQRNWRVMADDMVDLISLLIDLPNTTQNQAAIKKITDYLASSRGDIATTTALDISQPDSDIRFKHVRDNKEMSQLAGDLTAAMKILRASADPEASIANMIARYNKENRLAGGDPWLNHLEEQTAHWDHLQKAATPEATAFVTALQSVTSSLNWGHGELGALHEMLPWFAALAKARGVDLADSIATTKLMHEVFDRGFSEFKSRDLTSEGKLGALERAFREMTVEARTGINLRAEISIDELKAKHPERVAELLGLLGISEKQLLKRGDADVLLEHMATLADRDAFYKDMEATALEMGASTAGITQNVTEVAGEIALTQHVLKNEEGFELAIPFGKGTGFDQVWVRTKNGVTEFIIGEAKGAGAALGNPGKGPQMSAKWVFNTIREMLASPVGSPEHNLAQQMMDAIRASRLAGGGAMRPIRGLVIEESIPPDHKNNTTAETGLNGYDFSTISLPGI